MARYLLFGRGSVDEALSVSGVPARTVVPRGTVLHVWREGTWEPVHPGVHPNLAVHYDPRLVDRADPRAWDGHGVFDLVVFPGLGGTPDLLLLCDDAAGSCPVTAEGAEHTCTGVLGRPELRGHELYWAACEPVDAAAMDTGGEPTAAARARETRENLHALNRHEIDASAGAALRCLLLGTDLLAVGAARAYPFPAEEPERPALEFRVAVIRSERKVRVSGLASAGAEERGNVIAALGRLVPDDYRVVCMVPKEGPVRDGLAPANARELRKTRGGSVDCLLRGTVVAVGEVAERAEFRELAAVPIPFTVSYDGTCMDFRGVPREKEDAVGRAFGEFCLHTRMEFDGRHWTYRGRAAGADGGRPARSAAPVSTEGGRAGLR
ncbi:hypothetical protein [Streptomyces vinaceus]|uniref:hypothetical protein n=1 Tax=Streptomyces vinaceus TaxID=1960 RepID=UPI00367FCF8C